MCGEEAKSAMKRQFPIIITVRDRLSDLLLLLDWLNNVGQREVWLCDNASTYEPMVRFLSTTKHHVIYNQRNLGHRSPLRVNTQKRSMLRAVGIILSVSGRYLCVIEMTREGTVR